MTKRIQLANALRILSIDAIQKAKSGHPGMPMGMADIAEVLWNDFLKHNPSNPKWPNRDRFVLSNGHGSMLLYALLHLSGYDLNIDDLKRFRQLHSKTPGHPEYGTTPGVEVTTGPLGQGLACAVGMALAERLLANKFNKEQYQIIDNYTYCFVGDGCLMEGISYEACSLAGTLGLGKLIVFWDNNGFSIDGKTNNWFNEDIVGRFNACNWHVIADIDGHNPEAIKDAIIAAKNNIEQPTIICCKTIIGFGSPNFAKTAKCHGAPLGEEEIVKVRKQLNWEFSPFYIPDEFYVAWDAKKKGQQAEDKWNNLFNEYKNAYPNLAQELQRRWQKELPNNWLQIINDFAKQNNTALATREASKNTLDTIGDILPELIGGSADLSCSNLTVHKHVKTIMPKELNGNYIYYGVREFAMTSIMNGLALYGGFIPYGGTFLVFSDYARSAIRMSALMKQRVIYVLTHDSIGVGEDGPTHQPIEHLAMLRITPNVSLWRPADATETAVAWQMAIERTDGPTVLALSRQKLKSLTRTQEQIELIKKGGYVLLDCNDTPEIIFIATGSEVEISLEAAELLAKQQRKIRVVSMPSIDIFLKQDKKYRLKVLPKNTKKIAIEAGATAIWHQFVGETGRIIGIDCFGKSAPYKEVYKACGITVEGLIYGAGFSGSE